jgi:hypothetical protein
MIPKVLMKVQIEQKSTKLSDGIDFIGTNKVPNRAEKPITFGFSAHPAAGR